MTRRPQGYQGTNHETIGSDLLSVLKVLPFPDRVLGPELTKQLQAVKPDGWYPIGDLLDVMEKLEKAIGRPGLKQMGRSLFQLSHAAEVKKVAKSAADILLNFDTLYRRANRGTAIGGWSVVEFKSGRARLEKTTPHHCAMEEGIILEALWTVEIPALVSQKRCFRNGDVLCEYEVTSVVHGDKWMGGRPAIG